jgi:hypothetical protein
MDRKSREERFVARKYRRFTIVSKSIWALCRPAEHEVENRPLGPTHSCHLPTIAEDAKDRKAIQRTLGVDEDLLT